MFRYNYRLRERYGEDVVSLAVLTDSRPKVRPDRYEVRRWGFELRMRFPVVKLLDYAGREAELEASRNPFALVVLAHLEVSKIRKGLGTARGAETGRRGGTLATAGREQAAFEAKWRLTRMLYRRGWGRDDILKLYRFIDWLIRLPEDLERRIEERRQELEGTKTMPYISTMERWAMERGRKEGEQEGVRKGLLKAIEAVLELRFGADGLALLPRVRNVTEVRRLESLLVAVRRAKTLRGFAARLRR
jgi:hypothetical protein